MKKKRNAKQITLRILSNYYVVFLWQSKVEFMRAKAKYEYSTMSGREGKKRRGRFPS